MPLDFARWPALLFLAHLLWPVFSVALGFSGLVDRVGSKLEWTAVIVWQAVIVLATAMILIQRRSLLLWPVLVAPLVAAIMENPFPLFVLPAFVWWFTPSADYTLGNVERVTWKDLVISLLALIMGFILSYWFFESLHYLFMSKGPSSSDKLTGRAVFTFWVLGATVPSLMISRNYWVGRFRSQSEGFLNHLLALGSVIVMSLFFLVLTAGAFYIVGQVIELEGWILLTFPFVLAEIAIWGGVAFVAYWASRKTLPWVTAVL